MYIVCTQDNFLYPHGRVSGCVIFQLFLSILVPPSAIFSTFSQWSGGSVLLHINLQQPESHVQQAFNRRCWKITTHNFNYYLISYLYRLHARSICVLRFDVSPTVQYAFFMPWNVLFIFVIILLFTYCDLDSTWVSFFLSVPPALSTSDLPWPATP